MSSNAPATPARVEERVRTFYERYPFPHYRAGDASYDAAMDRLYAALGFGPQLRDQVVLDAGCGTGEHSAYLGRWSPRLAVGLDLSAQSLDVARRRAAAHGAERTAFIHGSIRALPVRAGQIDAVVCCGVLHHMAEPWAGLRELTVALKPGGLLLFFVYNRYAHWVTEVERRLLGLVAGRDPQRRIRWARRLFGAKYRRAWQHWETPDSLLADSYAHPHEIAYPLGTVLRRLQEAGLTIEAATPPMRSGAFWTHLAARDAQGRYLNAPRTRRPWAWVARAAVALGFGGDRPGLPTMWDRIVVQAYLAYCGVFGYSQGITILARKDAGPAR